VQRWIEGLNSETFAMRDKASAELAKLGGLAEGAMRTALKAKPSLETQQRLEKLLNRLLLCVAGQLNLAMGGPGYEDFKLFVRGATYYYVPLDVDDKDHKRRTLYRTWARSGRNSLLDNLDCPDPSTATAKRNVTTTPLQALAMMNNAFVLRMADYLAERSQREAGPDVSDQVTRVYELAFGRSPSDEERALARRVAATHGLSVVCRAVFNSNEFMYLD
jgi:hypothetical protein